MSSAFYPQGMNSWNNRLPQGGYKTWKGRGVFSNPVGVTATHIRPLTNLDPGNVFPTGFGLPRPLKHYRKGTVIPIPESVFSFEKNNAETNVQKTEIDLIEYNVNRAVKSSNGSSLGGGNGGTGIISQMIDMPGSFIVKDNNTEFVTTDNYVGLDNNINIDETNKIDKDCKNCQGVGIVSSWYPINNLTEKPQQNVTNPLLCCNQQRKAIQRVLPTSTIVKKNYYQTTYMYLYNRCQTFQQRQFNFLAGVVDPKIFDFIKTYPFVSAEIVEYIKPGEPLSYLNLYVAQCNPNGVIETGILISFINAVAKNMKDNGIITNNEFNMFISSNIMSIKSFIDFIRNNIHPDRVENAAKFLYELSLNPYYDSVISGPTNPKGCQKVYYKPNNPQFAQQGGVSSSTRTLKLTVDTITTSAAKNRINRVNGSKNEFSSISKLKAPTCQASTYSGNPFFFSGQFQNKKICSKSNGDEYKNYVSINQKSRGNYIGSTLP